MGFIGSIIGLIGFIGSIIGLIGFIGSIIGSIGSLWGSHPGLHERCLSIGQL